MQVVDAAYALLDKLGRDRIAALIAEGAPHKAVPLLWSALT